MMGGEINWQVDKNDVDNAHLFNLSTETCLSLDSTYNTALVQRNLSQQVARSPHNLRVHCQRILLAINNEDRMHLAGYLQDLFIVLGDLGKSLKTRMLLASRPLLNLQKKTEFDQWLTLGADYQEAYNWSDGSVLSTDAHGGLLVAKVQKVSTTSVITITGSNSSTPISNVLEEAKSYLEYGQIEEAKEVLEAAVLDAQVIDAELEDELLNIYYYTRDSEALLKMSEKIKKKGGELSEAWKAMREISLTWST